MNTSTNRLSLTLLGEPQLLWNDQALELPPSKKTRALLAFLALTNRPHRRDRLCEIFCSSAEDPRAALRWSLSKVRQLVNKVDDTRLQADRERVFLNMDDIAIDIHQIAQHLNAEGLSPSALETLYQQLQEPFLDGLELPEQDLFQQWLRGERQEVVRLQGRVLAKLASHAQLNIPQRLEWARVWLSLEPLNPRAATRLVSELKLQQATDELVRVTENLVQRFRNAGMAWSPDRESVDEQQGSIHSERDRQREFLLKQKINFCTAADGVRLAYASVGRGTPILKAANWLSHLEHDWDAPIWSPLFRDLASDHHFIRYDERGNGLSDWNVEHISFDDFVTDLETVADASGLDSFALLGISQGAAVSIEYAIRHPERVSQLILFGGYDAGWRIDATDDTIREREAIMTLTKSGWGNDNPAYRQIFSSTFMPSANADELAWFNEFQRLTTSPENAVRFLSVFGDIDVRDKLAQVKVPTLVIHSVRDNRIPVSVAHRLASTIPNATFVGLDSDGHLLLGREPASGEFVQAVRQFIHASHR
ncbi:MAG: alpha/beta fold hydrolase [Reinekea sp.]|nr:alpha/beta fold hydrolase [Reinekea sp.]